MNISNKIKYNIHEHFVVKLMFFLNWGNWTQSGITVYRWHINKDILTIKTETYDEYFWN